MHQNEATTYTKACSETGSVRSLFIRLYAVTPLSFFLKLIHKGNVRETLIITRIACAHKTTALGPSSSLRIVSLAPDLFGCVPALNFTLE